MATGLEERRRLLLLCKEEGRRVRGDLERAVDEGERLVGEGRGIWQPAAPIEASGRSAGASSAAPAGAAPAEAAPALAGANGVAMPAAHTVRSDASMSRRFASE